MTCLEKYMLEHPDSHGCFSNCPSTYGYMPDPEYCCKESSFTKNCAKCWDREIPETLQWPKENPHISDSAKTAIKLLGESARRAAENIVTAAASIKDSGDRTEFETGAVRDMREGKGRCDLMPLGVVATFMQNNQILHELRMFLDSMDTNCLYRCLETFSRCYEDDSVKANMGEVYTQRRCTMFLEVAKHFEEGAKKYGENNWQKGIPVKCYIDSAVRHYLKWLRGDKDEPHDRAFVWNLMCCIWEVDYREKEESDVEE